MRSTSLRRAMQALAALTAALLAGVANAARPAAPVPAPAREEVAVFAGGCFWCMETQFEGLPGVRSVVSGYTGGHEADPTYEEVGRGGTGHLEAIEVRFDPRRIGYARLLDVFWHSIDPTQGDGQFCDRGSQYRSAVFYKGESQRRLAEESRRRIARDLARPVVTEVRPAGPFHAAEEYHQDYWKKDPVGYRTYRAGCGRDQRLARLWGKLAARPSAH